MQRPPHGGLASPYYRAAMSIRKTDFGEHDRTRTASLDKGFSARGAKKFSTHSDPFPSIETT